LGSGDGAEAASRVVAVGQEAAAVATTTMLAAAAATTIDAAARGGALDSPEQRAERRSNALD